MFEGAVRWTRLTSGPLIGTGTASLVTLVANTLLLRVLPIQDAGIFALSIALIQTLNLFGALGQVTIITRLYSRDLDGSFDWLRDLGRLGLLSTVPIGLGIFVCTVLYSLPPGRLILLAIASALTVPINLSASMLNAKLHHTWGAVLMRLPNSLLIIPALLATWWGKGNDVDSVLLAYTLSTAVVVVGSFLLLKRLLPRGGRTIRMDQHVEGLVFILASGAQLLLDQGLVAIAGAIVLPDTLAAFAAVAILIRPFRLVTSILSMVFGPRFIRQDRESYRRLLLSIGLFGGLAAVAASAITPLLATAIYGPRFSSGYGAVPWLSLAGFLLLIRSVPISHMSGRAPISTVTRVVLIESTVVAVAALLSILLVHRLGIYGLAIGFAVGHLVRTSTTFLLWARFREADPFRRQAISL